MVNHPPMPIEFASMNVLPQPNKTFPKLQALLDEETLHILGKTLQPRKKVGAMRVDKPGVKFYGSA